MSEESLYIIIPPIRIKRIPKEAENTLSEIDLIQEIAPDDTEKYELPALSIKRTLMVAAFGFAVTYIHCFLFLLWKQNEQNGGNSEADLSDSTSNKASNG